MTSNLRCAVAAIVLAAWGATGCRFTGPATIQVGRGMYNAAVQKTNNEQLLLNIVRLRYRDTPFFLEVASVSTNFTFEAAVDASAELPNASPNIYGVGAGVGVSEQPTVTYTPLQGDQFVKQLLAPIDSSLLMLLYHSGWSISRILRVCVERLGGLPNAPSASGPTPARPPTYERFLRAVELLRELQVQGALEIGQSGDPTRPGLDLRIAQTARDGNEARELEELLGRSPVPGEYRLLPGAGTAEPGVIGLRMRSLAAAFFYVSQGVEAPHEHEEAGWVSVTRKADGEVFDWTALTGDLLRVRSARVRPLRAFVKTPYNGWWFYIDPADLDSKSTFALLAQLFALQGGSVPSTAPVLTLPVSR